MPRAVPSPQIELLHARVVTWLRVLPLVEVFVQERHDPLGGCLAGALRWSDDNGWSAADGREAAAAAVYADCPTPDAVVHLDRLCRTLHALNFLGQRRHAGGYLQVAVHRRHLQAIPNQHGLVYEAILKRCGLAPADIVLHIEATADGLLNEALSAYRQRGYRLSLGGTLPAAGTLAALAPEIVQIGATAPGAWFAAARAAGALVERCCIDDGRHYQAARDAGCDLGQGALCGLPAADCRATHEQRRLAYNAPLHNGATP